MEVAMCEAGQRSNRNSKDFEIDTDFITNTNSVNLTENFSSTASNASSGTKANNEFTSLASDYTTVDNIQLYKGQHVQIIQRLNNEFVLVQLVNNNSTESSDIKSKQIIEVQIPVSLIKSRNKLSNLDDIQSTSTCSNATNANTNSTETDESAKVSALINSTAAAAAKRKGSFKKWLRSSHRKFTSNGTNTSRLNTKNDNPQQKTLNLSSSSDLKKVLSNSDDIKMKNWLIEENNEDLDENNEDLEENSMNDQDLATLTTTSTSSITKLNNGVKASTDSTSLLTNTNNTSARNGNGSVSGSGNLEEDQEDLTSSIPPPMIVIKPEHAEQNTSSSFSKLPTQSIDIQRELKLWQSKMESSKKELLKQHQVLRRRLI